VTLVSKIAAGLALPVAFVAFVGFAHTPPGRPLKKYLGFMASAAGCPVGGREPTPLEMEAQRLQTTQAMKGALKAASRSALSFQLRTTTRDDAKAWAATHGVACTEQLEGAALDCQAVPGEAVANALPLGADSLYLRFDLQGRLVALDAQVRRPVEAAAGSYSTMVSGVASTLGAPGRTFGDASALYLASAPYQRGAVEYRFSDLAVDLSVMSMPGARGNDGLVRAQFRSIDD